MIKPIGDKLIVETIEEGSSSVILLNPEKPQKGKVIARGSKVHSDVQIGTHVYFARYAGVEVKENGVTYLILEEKDIVTYE
jgi:chaperonin GroES